MTTPEQDRFQKDALIRHLHGLGANNETSIAITKDEDGDHVAIAELNQARAVVVAHATVVESVVLIDEIWLEGDALQAAGHAVIRALARVLE